MNKLNLAYLKSISKDIEFEKENSYHKSYPHFIRFFQENEINEQNLVIASFFVYGWMPTILKKTKINGDVIEKLNKAKNGHLFSVKELNDLKGFINNSVVGLSKLLHFINPNIYGIWDSRICKLLTNKNHQQKVNNAKNYREYLDKLQAVKHEMGFEEWVKDIYSIQPKNYPDFPLRAVEMTLFHVATRKD